MTLPPAKVLETAAALAGTAGLVTGGWFYAALWPQSQLFGHVLVDGPDPLEIALTYDDGPNPAATPQLLELLARHNLRATFFLIGSFVRQQPHLARQIAAAGHLVGNHTMTHPWLAWQSAARIRNEIAGCNALLEDVLGAPVRFFRPPHGARRPAVFHTAAELDLTVVQWNVIAQDWIIPSDPSVDLPGLITARVQAGIARNQRRRRATNVVLHDGGDRSLGQPRLATVAATGRLIAAANRAGSRFVTPADWL